MALLKTNHTLEKGRSSVVFPSIFICLRSRVLRLCLVSSNAVVSLADHEPYSDFLCDGLAPVSTT
jgi:hypothetical protein